MTTFAEGKEYRVVLNSVPGEAAGAVVAELVRLFPIEVGPAKGIVKAAPIILVDKLTPQQARNAESHLGFLRRLGADVTVTSDQLSSVKRMTLPVKPDIVRRPGNVFICPTCGDRLVVCPEGSVESAGSPPAPAKTAPVRESAPEKPVAREPAAEEANPSQQPTAAEAPVSAPHKPVIKSWPKVASAGEPSVRQEPGTRRSAAVPEAADVKSSPVTPKTQKAAGEIPKRIEPASEAPAPSDAQREEPADKPKAPSEEEEITILEPGAVGGAPATEGPASGPGKCRVSLAKKLKRSQRKTVSELIAKYQNIPLKEAIGATKKSIVTIMRNATREQAEQCKEECKQLGISVQISER